LEAGLLVAQAGLVAVLLGGAILRGMAGADAAWLLAALGAALSARALVRYLRERAGIEAGARVQDALRRELLGRLFPARKGAARRARPFEEDGAGALAGACLEEVEAVGEHASRYLPARTLALVVPLAIVLAVAPLSWLGALLLGLTAPLVPLLGWIVGLGASRAAEGQMKALGRLASHFVDRLRGLPTLQILGRTGSEAKAVGEAAEEVRRRTMGVLRIAFLSSAVVELFSALGVGLMAVYLGLALLGSLDVGFWGRPLSFEVALFLLILAAELYLPIRGLGSLFHLRAGALGAAERLRRWAPMASAPPAPSANPEPRASKGRLASLDPRSTLLLEGVSVQPIGAERPILSVERLELRPGETLAVVGPSGAGKSTLLGLILGAQEPVSGRMAWGATELDELGLEERRAHLSWVGQQPRLFHGTLRGNIALARPGARDDEVIAAARAACAEPFLVRLPDGLDTAVGELGAGLSAGQIQRVALARCFLKDAPLVLLDEPTASLDPLSEAAVLRAVERLRKGRTTLLVTHRPEACRIADRIAVLVDGELRELGAHGELAASGGYYARWLAEAGERGSEVEGQGDEPERSGEPPGGHAARGTALDESVEPRLRPHGEELNGPMSIGGIGGPGEGPAGAGELRFLWRRLAGGRRILAYGVLAGLMTALAAVGLMAVGGSLLAVCAISGLAAPGLWNPVVGRLGAGIRFFAIVRTLGRYGERILTHEATLKGLARLRKRFFEQLALVSPVHLGKQRRGDLLDRLVSDVESLGSLTHRLLAPWVMGLGLALLVTAALAFVHPGLALVCGSVFFALLLVLPRIGQALTEGLGAEVGEQGRRLRAHLVEALGGRLELEVFGAAARERQSLESELGELVSLWARRARAAAAVGSAAMLCSGLGMLGLLWVGGLAVRGGLLEPVHLGALALALMTAFDAAAPVALGFVERGRTRGAARRLAQVEEEAGRAAARSRGISGEPRDEDERAASGAPPVLRLEDVTLFPPGSPSPILSGIRLEVAPGERLALLGASGAGKTSLLQVVLGFWEPTAGRVTIGGVPIAELGQPELGRLVTAATELPHIFGGTLEQNLRLGRPEASEAELWEALAVAQLAEEVRTWPEGLQTYLRGTGDLLERREGLEPSQRSLGVVAAGLAQRELGALSPDLGRVLSAGEARRVALGRVLLGRAGVLLLDEPTADLDPHTASRLLQALFQATAGQTLILATHDGRVAAAADRVVT
jgi:ATP-binding cassette subfamily C protein CydCD